MIRIVVVDVHGGAQIREHRGRRRHAQDDGDSLIITKEADMDSAVEEMEEVKEKRPPASFPPPIRSIGRSGKRGVCFRSFRADGQFILMEVLIPGKDLLHAYCDGDQLRLQFATA